MVAVSSCPSPDEPGPRSAAHLEVVSTQRFRPFFKLESTVNGIRNIDLAPKTALVGPLRSGKTSLMTGARAALTGEVPVGKRADLIGRLSVMGDRSWKAVLSGPDGSVGVTFDGKELTRLRPEGRFLTDLPDSQLPFVVADADAVGPLGADKLREAIVRRFGNLTEVPAFPAFNAVQNEVWVRLLAHARGPERGKRSPLEVMTEIPSIIRSWTKSYSTTLKTAEGAFKTAKSRYEEAKGATKVDVVGLRAKEAVARKWEQSAPLRSRIAELEEKIAKLGAAPDAPPSKEALEKAVLAADMAERGLTNLRANVDRAKWLAEKHQQLVEAQQCSCVLCARPFNAMDELLALKAQYDGMLATFEGMLQAAEEKFGPLKAEKERLAKAVVEETTRLASAKMERATLDASLSALQDQLEAIGAPASYSGPSSDDLKKQISAGGLELDAALARLESTRIHFEKAKAEHEALGVIADEVRAFLGKELRTAADACTQALNRYAPPGFEFMAFVEQRDDTVAVTLTARSTDGEFRDLTLSGSENALLQMARLRAWGEGLPLSVAIVDTTMLGEVEPIVGDVFQLLGKAVDDGHLTQAVVAWWHEKDVPKDWHIVRLEEVVVEKPVVASTTVVLSGAVDIQEVRQAVAQPLPPAQEEEISF